MTSRLVAVAFDAHDPSVPARFWAALLGREVLPDARGALLPGTQTQVGLRFVPSDSEKAGVNPLHPHLTSTDAADQQRTVATALELGARRLDLGQRPEERHVVLADPEGNEFCVIEPGNAFLAGCGPLGEIACDGSRGVGLFWAAALGWPLVWDRGQETAVQSPLGGTKVSWGGEDVGSQLKRNRQRLELVAEGGDRTAEVERLVSLGATRLGAGQDGTVTLADPDGNGFRL